MATSQPGVEFSEERLQRCLAIPEGERSADVAAFIESQQLLAEARSLLPLTAGGKAALTPTPANRRQLLSALLHMTRADYLVASEAVTAHGETDCAVASCAPEWVLPLPGGHGSGSAGEEAEQLLLETLFVVVLRAEPGAPQHAYTSLSRMLHALSNPGVRAAVSRRLEQSGRAAGDQHQQQQPVLSARELQHLCCCRMATCCFTLSMYANPEMQQILQQMPAAVRDSLCETAHASQQLTRQQLAEVEAMGEQCKARLLQLEPNNPKSIGTVAGLQINPQLTATLYLRAYELGRQQRSDHWLIGGACQAFKQANAALDMGSGQRATVEAALAALQDVAPALRRCKRLLPGGEVQMLEISIAEARRWSACYRRG